MPLYSYRCADCDCSRVEMRLIAERESKPLPTCDRCKQAMTFELSPTAGYVKNPAAGHTRRI